MNIFSGERDYEPSSDDYVRSYIKFYAKRMGGNAAGKINEDGTDDVSISAKTHLVDDLYKNLDTLDSKAGAILTFCGIVLASISILISFNQITIYIPILYVLFIAVSISSVLALSVINVHWASPRELRHRTLEEACYSYYATKLYRTRRYILSWHIIFYAIIILGGYILLDLFFVKLSIISR